MPAISPRMNGIGASPAARRLRRVARMCPQQITGRAALAAHLLGLAAGVATIVGLIAPVGNLVRMLN